MKKSVMCIIIAVLFSSKTHSKAENFKEHDFHSFLLEHNITVEGKDVDFTKSCIRSLIEELNLSWHDAVQERYTSALQENDRFITVSSEDILELHFYSLSDRDQEDFIRKAENQKVTVEADRNGDVILISYNPN